jgi:ATP-dependent DNA helicase RecQ
MSERDAVEQVLQKYWGYSSFRPLQREAMESVLEQRDSVVVLPTGGGKSLCFQVPALCHDGLAVVVSPLISLMKDQVDGLQACGVPAACVNSTQSADERRRIAAQLRAGQLRLLYVSPERLLSDRMLQFLETIQVAFFAIDEAHCISSWGHDFRPEFRGLSLLKERFPNQSVHAYTATASEQVRLDIAEQLTLNNPRFLVGSFDRPNLTYRVRPKAKIQAQIESVIERHRDEAGIVYCISRAEVERTAVKLQDAGIRALPYHAGLDDEIRRRNQESFIEDRAQVIVATVAFGMGIDKPNVRFVIHAGMPKSLESYQQESGRAGRDGLNSECWLFYSPGDFLTWKNMIHHEDASAQEGAVTSLQAMSDFCGAVTCRHQAIVRYFGEELPQDNCGACDVCLNELDLMDDPLRIGQMILSCVLRLQQRFGADYTAQVLQGSRDQRILQQGHDKLSTWGLLTAFDRRQVRDWIEQLVAQRFLEKTGEYNTLEVTQSGRELLRGNVTPRLLRPAKRGSKRQTETVAESMDGVDLALFESLRKLRRDQAEQRNVPAYIIFGDATLRDMARRCPKTLEEFRNVRGVGDRKCEDFGELFLNHIRQHTEHEAAT